MTARSTFVLAKIEAERGQSFLRAISPKNCPLLCPPMRI